MAHTWSTLQPSRIRGNGYAIYLAAAREWVAGGGKGTSGPPSRVTSTLDPDSARRIAEARAAKPQTIYLDPITITGDSAVPE